MVEVPWDRNRRFLPHECSAEQSGGSRAGIAGSCWASAGSRFSKAILLWVCFCDYRASSGCRKMFSLCFAFGFLHDHRRVIQAPGVSTKRRRSRSVISVRYRECRHDAGWARLWHCSNRGHLCTEEKQPLSSQSLQELIVSALLIIIMINYLAGTRQTYCTTTADFKKPAIFSCMPRCKIPLKPRNIRGKKIF